MKGIQSALGPNSKEALPESEAASRQTVEKKEAVKHNTASSLVGWTVPASPRPAASPLPPVAARRRLRHPRDLPRELEHARVVQGAAHVHGVLSRRRADPVVVVGGGGQRLVVALHRFEN